MVTCLYNSGKDLDPPGPQSLFYTEESVFQLKVGKAYPVFGLGIWKGTLLTLTVDDTGEPDWLPAGLFETESVELPEEWRFSVLDGMAASSGRPKDDWVAVWGYPELVENSRHRDGLVERDPAALALFYRELESRLFGADQNLNFSIRFSEKEVDHVKFFDCILHHDGLGAVAKLEILHFHQQLKVTPPSTQNGESWSYDREMDAFFGHLSSKGAFQQEKRKGRAAFDRGGELVRLESLGG